RIVIPVVVGSSPISHPKKSKSAFGRFFVAPTYWGLVSAVPEMVGTRVVDWLRDSYKTSCLSVLGSQT
ncbi:MAG: hypothetical protein KA211_00330, partial [Xylophilus sp.]|nr:hypothetical protein [Xylophilus sp.]